jgi:hypothetical protein
MTQLDIYKTIDDAIAKIKKLCLEEGAVVEVEVRVNVKDRKFGNLTFGYLEMKQ